MVGKLRIQTFELVFTGEDLRGAALAAGDYRGNRGRFQGPVRVYEQRVGRLSVCVSHRHRRRRVGLYHSREQGRTYVQCPESATGREYHHQLFPPPVVSTFKHKRLHGEGNNCCVDVGPSNGFK
ncbi:hypothetical protein AAC387_Pa08g2551 [Persea americana]